MGHCNYREKKPGFFKPGLALPGNQVVALLHDECSLSCASDRKPISTQDLRFDGFAGTSSREITSFF